MTRVRDWGHRLGVFFQELRRRRVIRVAIGYAAVALVAIEGASNILEPLGFDQAAMRIIVLVAIAGFPVAVVLAWVYDVTGGRIVRTTAASTNGAHGPVDEVVRHPATNLAVLPFIELSGGTGDRYFSDGVTDDIISTLSRIPSLRVTSRTSAMTYRTAGKAMAAIAEELRVGSVLEGSVRRAGQRVRIVARLVDPATDEQVWGATYDRDIEDILGVQAEVAGEIAQALEAELSADETTQLLSASPTNGEAYDAYLRGCFHWNRRTESGMRASVEHLERAVELDPGFAAAHAALAESRIGLGLYSVVPPAESMPQAREAALEALRLDPRNGEALSALACVQSLYDWDWEEAEATFLRAIDASPSYATARQWYALHLLTPQRRFHEADQQLIIAHELDPASAPIRASQAFLASLDGRCGKAVEVGESLVKADPGFAMGHFLLGQALAACDRHEEAVRSLETAASIRGFAPETRAALAQALAGAGREKEARAIQRVLSTDGSDEYVSPARMAQLFAALGDNDEALDELEKAAELRAVDLAWIAVLPGLRKMKSDERYGRVLARMGLPQR